MRLISASSAPSTSPRNGAVLLEVLIAILAMGIGVVSLMSLFPLSVVRTAQAHQLTVGTGLRLNAEAVLENYPNFWIDPDPTTAKPGATDRYLVDPLGKLRVNTATIGMLNRYDAGYTSTSTPTAKQIATYDGNWLSQADEVGVTSTATSVTFGTTVNLSAVPNVAGPIPSRILVYDGTGKFSATRIITSIASPNSAPTVNWNENVTFAIARARVETQDEQFTWALTVHRFDTAAEYTADLFVPVFFRREFSQDSEQEYNVSDPVVNPPNPPPPPNVKVVSYSAPNRPAIRKGGYLLDSVNGRWYRVSDYSENTATSELTVVLEFAPAPPLTKAVFFRGLVDVFPLGTKQVKK